jgi:hypothetical protein
MDAGCCCLLLGGMPPPPRLRPRLCGEEEVISSTQHNAADSNNRRVGFFMVIIVLAMVTRMNGGRAYVYVLRFFCSLYVSLLRRRGRVRQRIGEMTTGQTHQTRLLYLEPYCACLLCCLSNLRSLKRASLSSEEDIVVNNYL